MPRKLLTFLGTTSYKPCTYVLGTQQSQVVSFVQEALVEMVCNNWTDSDQICIFLTQEAKDKNWENGLQQKLEQSNMPCQVRAVDNFKEGFGEQQIQENFDLIYRELGPNDEIWLDITNAFRSIPIFALVLLNYARFLKGVEIKAIYYGAFESLGIPAHQIDAIIPNPAERRVPIIDLKKLVDLQQWTNAANDFLIHGNALELAKLSREQGHEEFAQALSAITGAFSVVRGKELEKGALFEQFTTALQSLQSKSPELEAILSKVESAFAGFQTNDILNGFRAAEWCHQHQLYQQGITILRETIVTLICQQAGLPKDTYDFGRKYVEWAFNCYGRDRVDWKIPSNAFDKLDAIIDNTQLERFAGVYQSLSHHYRNDINHGGFLYNAKLSTDFAEALANHIDQVRQLHNF